MGTLLSLWSGAHALDLAPAADQWRALATLDVEAAYAFIKDNHPGAAPEAGDPQFVAALDAAHAEGLARAALVTNHEGLTAVLGEFAGRMRDGHIGARPRFVAESVYWAGIVAAKRGPHWIAASVDPKLAPGISADSQILSCDGQSAETRAEEALKFRTDITDSALQVMRGVWFLADDGNPFLARPKSCEFQQDGKVVALALQWTRIGRNKLLNEVWKRPYGSAGFGLRASGTGYWVGIQELSSRAQGVIDSVVQQASALRAAPYVVVDLRGNGGGDDAYARALADALYGSKYVRSVLGPPASEGGCPSVYRASPGNIEASEELAAAFDRSGDVAGAEMYRDANRRMKLAAAAGHSLTGSVSCPRNAKSVRDNSASLMRGRVFLLTDAACFSSCLAAAQYFRALGAVHVGQATSACTHYSESRSIVLPSGLTTFFSLWALMPDSPARLGPFVPAHAYDDDISDTAKLEQWIAQKAAAAAGP